MIPRFRKLPSVIEAIQWTGHNLDQIWDAFGAADIYGPTEVNPGVLTIATIEGDMKAPVGFWIIRGLIGELYACEPGVFDLSYERADGAPLGRQPSLDR